MIQLTPDESRVLGVLIEKSLTTPDQYPLSLNAIVNGANQKNNWDPISNLTEDAVFDALESLRGKGLVVRVDTPGARVHKYKHQAGETLHARTGEVAIIAELLLRGPQTLGELRGRASRMAPMESLDAARDLLRALMDRPEPLVREIPRSPGSRAEQYAQLLCPDLHAISSAPASVPLLTQESSGLPLVERVTALEADVAALRAELRRLASALGETVNTQETHSQ
jgi:uncharacterized protein YceH (UPF0502 family)